LEIAVRPGTTVSDLIDGRPFSKFQIGIVVQCGALILLEGFAAQCIGFLAPGIAQDLSIPLKSFGPIFSAALAGLTIGALSCGPIADRYGRKIVIVSSTLMFALFTALTASAGSIQGLLVMRFLTGVGLGGAMPNAVALTAEYTPKRLQTVVVSAIFAGMPLGAATASLLSTRMLPHWGWRSVFYLGGLLSLMIAVSLIRSLPESVKFLTATGANPRKVEAIIAKLVPSIAGLTLSAPAPSYEQASGLPIKHLFTKGRVLGTMLLWITFFMNLLLLYFFINWLPGLLTTVGMPISAGVIAAGLFGLGGVIGSLVQGSLMNMRGSSATILTEFLLSIVLIIWLSCAKSFMVIMAATLILGMLIQGAQAGLNALSASFYPTTIRSTGVGWALGIGRIGSIIGPLVGGMMLLRGWTPSQIFLAGTVPALIAALAVLLSGSLGSRPNPFPPKANPNQSAVAHLYGEN
jgi:AAHS family 4-hydroxybenzoate transporter-like MFS transporter